VHFTAFCLGGPFFSGHGVQTLKSIKNCETVGGPLTTGGPPSRDAAATPSLRHWLLQLATTAFYTRDEAKRLKKILSTETGEVMNCKMR